MRGISRFYDLHAYQFTNETALISDDSHVQYSNVENTGIGILERFSALQPVSFTSNIDGNESNGYGFRGENMRSVFPELMREALDRTLEDGSITKTRDGLDVTSLVVQSVGAINELKAEKDAEIESLNQTIEDLVKRIEDIENR